MLGLGWEDCSTLNEFAVYTVPRALRFIRLFIQAGKYDVNRINQQILGYICGTKLHVKNASNS